VNSYRGGITAILVAPKNIENMFFAENNIGIGGEKNKKFVFLGC
jgi:hypothetical protein